MEKREQSAQAVVSPSTPAPPGMNDLVDKSQTQTLRQFFSDLNALWKPQQHQQTIIAAPCRCVYCTPPNNSDVIPDICGLLYTRFRANHLNREDCPLTVDGYGTGEANFPSFTNFGNIRVLHHPGNRQRHFTTRCMNPRREDCFGTGVQWNRHCTAQDTLCRPLRDPVSCYNRCRKGSRKLPRRRRSRPRRHGSNHRAGSRPRTSGVRRIGRYRTLDPTTFTTELPQRQNFGQQMDPSQLQEGQAITENQGTIGAERPITPLHSSKGKENIPSTLQKDFQAMFSGSRMPHSAQSKEVFSSFIAQMEAAGKVSKMDAERMIKLVNQNLVLNGAPLSRSQENRDDVHQGNRQCTLKRSHCDMGTDFSKPKVTRKQKGTCTESRRPRRHYSKQMQVHRPSTSGIGKCRSCNRISRTSYGIPKRVSFDSPLPTRSPLSTAENEGIPPAPEQFKDYTPPSSYFTNRGSSPVTPPPPQSPGRSYSIPSSPAETEALRKGYPALPPPMISRGTSPAPLPGPYRYSIGTTTTVLTQTQPTKYTRESVSSSPAPRKTFPDTPPPSESSPRSSQIPRPSLPQPYPRRDEGENTPNTVTVEPRKRSTSSGRSRQSSSSKKSDKSSSSSKRVPRPAWTDDFEPKVRAPRHKNSKDGDSTGDDTSADSSRSGKNSLDSSEPKRKKRYKPGQNYSSPYKFEQLKFPETFCEISKEDIPDIDPMRIPYPPQYRYDEKQLRRYSQQCDLLKQVCSKKKNSNQCYTPETPPSSFNPAKFNDFPLPDKCLRSPLFPGLGFPDGSCQYPFNNNNPPPSIQSGNTDDSYLDCGGICPIGLLNEPSKLQPQPPPYSKLKKKKKEDEKFMFDYITVRRDKNANLYEAGKDYCDLYKEKIKEKDGVASDGYDGDDEYGGRGQGRRSGRRRTLDDAHQPSDEITRFLQMKNVQVVKEQKTEIVKKHSGDKPQRLITQMDTYYTKTSDGRIRAEQQDTSNNNNQWASEDTDKDMRRLQQNTHKLAAGDDCSVLETDWEKEFKEFEMSCNRHKVRPSTPRPQLPGFLPCPMPETTPLMCRVPAVPTKDGRIICQAVPFPKTLPPQPEGYGEYVRQNQLAQVAPFLPFPQQQQQDQQRDYPYMCEIRYHEPIHGSIYGKVVTRRQPCRLIDPENQEMSNERGHNHPVIMETPFFNPSCPQRKTKPTKDRKDKYKR